ncbi:hypothetical protein Pla123a_06360 [Posidoniimonas polymericola]|uniref:STAS domain-containing protein n=1 Tax=Posidoniimonas polymericola TaxID=2528002 RepID=A0A5C5ZEH2_9BACT|nr:hypothetical protein [Posidoniimonas polymericola]TWT85829.1 hypothetical protein Pla123a_06360 [Posidoniimonas polymericola]
MAATLTPNTLGQHCRIDRGPNWLFVRLPDLKSDAATDHLVDEMWEICSRHFTYRLVVELDDLKKMPKPLTAQLDELRDKLHAQGGSLRLCGANSDCEQTLSGAHFAMPLRSHASRSAAVQG